MSTPYNPCRYGIHVCGINADETEFVTVANFPGAKLAMFESLRDEFSIEGDPDLVVDFVCDGDLLHDFGMRRQDLRAMTAIITAETAH